MGGSYIKMILREFKKSFGRFAAIFGIVALGVGFLSGLLITTPDMNNSVDTYYDNHNMADIFIKGTMGLTKDDLDEVKSQENVKDIMPAYVIDKLMQLNDKDVITTKIYGIPLLNLEDETIINELKLLQGRMPENNKECLVERKNQYIKDIKIGSRLKISQDNKDYEDIDDLYNVKEYTVVGVVGNSFHFAKEREFSNVGSGKLDAIIYVDKSSYALEEFTDFYIVLEDAIYMNSFSSEYQIYTEKVRKRLEKLSEDRSKNRKIEILDKANKKLKEGYDEYNEEKDKADTKLANALKEINKGKKDLKDAAVEIENAKVKLKDAKQTLKEENEKAQKDIVEGENDLKQAKLDLVDAEEKLKDAKIKLEDGQKEYNDGYEEYLEGKVKLEDGIKELEKGKKKLKDSEKELEDGIEELRIGKGDLEKAKRDLEKGESEYRNGVRELRAGRLKYLSSIEPLAQAVGYDSSETLISTSSGQRQLKDYLNHIKGEIASGLTQARDGKEKIEFTLPTLITAKENLESQIEQLNLEIQKIEKDSEENPEADIEANKQAIAKARFAIEQIKNGLQGTPEDPGPNVLIPSLQNKLGELQALILQLEAQQSEIPDFDFLLHSWDEIIQGERKLERAKEDLDDGFREYQKGIIKLRDAEYEIADAEIQLADGKKEIIENEKKVENAKKDLEEGFKELQSAKEDLEKGREEYQDGLLKFKDGQKEYEDGIIEIRDAKITLKEEIEKGTIKIEEGEKELKKGIIDYQEGVVEIEDGEKEYIKAKVEADEELGKAHNKLLDAEAEIKELEDPQWYVLDRDSNMSYVSFKLNADKVAAVSTVFPIFFYLVAGLVALTTMTRMVEEERTQIGVLKALGYKKSNIILKYILYCGLASTLGSIFGQMVGFNLIPKVIWNTYGVMYHLPEFITDYNKKIAFLSSGVAILSTITATFFATNDALREKPALLMLPKAPKKGKRILLERITPLWSAMSFNLKSTARNIFRYKKHFYMTVIGVSGCTALLVTGFGIRDSIKDIGKLQFDELFKYQLNIQLEEGYSENTLDGIANNEDIPDALEIYMDEGYIKFKGEIEDITLVVVDEIDNLSDYVLFRDRKDDEILDYDSGKIIITEKISEKLGIKSGDTINFENSDEVEKVFIVDTIIENYIGNYIYMDKNKYKAAFGSNPKNNTIYAKTKDLTSEEKDKLIETLYENEDILNAESISRSRNVFDNLIGSINYIVLVIIVASGLLAFIVLYNLTNININERRRELATLKVLGFHNNEVVAYIFREITILALIGTFTGLVLGKYLHQFIIVTVEDQNIMFGRNISIISYIISAVITMMFSIIVDLFMIKKIRNIKMVDSMKAND